MAELTIPIKVNLPENWLELVVDRLANDPSGEWVQVVRCKDCKHFEAGIMNSSIGVCCHDGWVDRQYSIGFEVSEDGYCSRGERTEVTP